MRQARIAVLVPCRARADILQDLDALREHPSVAEVLVTEGVRPVGRARNELLSRTGCELVLWLDADVVLPGKFVIDRLLAVIESRADVVGACAVSLVVPSSYMNSAFHVTEEIWRRSKPDIFEIDMCHFNCGLFRRSPLLEVGGFCDLAGEDNDMQMRLNRVSWKILGVRSLIVQHHTRMSLSKLGDYLAAHRRLTLHHGKYRDSQPWKMVLSSLPLRYRICRDLGRRSLVLFALAPPAYSILKSLFCLLPLRKSDG